MTKREINKIKKMFPQGSYVNNTSYNSTCIFKVDHIEYDEETDQCISYGYGLDINSDYNPNSFGINSYSCTMASEEEIKLLEEKKAEYEKKIVK